MFVMPNFGIKKFYDVVNELHHHGSLLFVKSFYEYGEQVKNGG